jgi:hypothetical protein
MYISQMGVSDPTSLYGSVEPQRARHRHRAIWKCQLQARNLFHIVPGLEDWKQKHGKVDLLQTTYLRAG